MPEAAAPDARSSENPSITIGFAQYSTTHRTFLPYSVGLLQASLQQRAQHPERYRFLMQRIYPYPVASEVEALLEADVAAFSLYVWNEQRTLTVARLLKQRKPEVLIVFGGPQVPDRPEAWLRANPWVDVCAHGEGEDTFLALMEALPGRDWSEIHGISWLADGNFIHHPPQPKRRDLDVFPSPFLTDVFEPLMAANPEQLWASTWETNRGCPFTCAFCDWGSATASRVNRFDTERLLGEIDWFAAHKIDYIFCADANFGILPRDLELATHAAEVKTRTGFPGALVVQNAKNISDRTFEIQCLMSRSGLDTQITISLQSLHPPTLKASGRQNISLEKFQELQNKLHAEGVHTYTDLIIGLPEETYDSFADGLATLISRGQYHALQFFCADILPNAPMADPAFRAKYRIETVSVPSLCFHTPVREDPDGIIEYQQMVVSTSSMSRDEWVKIRMLSWMVELLFYKPGTVRIPLLLLHTLGGISIRPLLEAFLLPEPGLPTLDWVRRMFENKARGVLESQPEFFPGLEPDGQLYWWGPCEAVLDLLIRSHRLEAYYREAFGVLQRFAKAAGLPEGLIEDGLFLSRNFIQLHSLIDPYPLLYHTRWNVWDYYQGLLAAEPVPLRSEHSVYLKDWAGAPFRVRCLAGSNEPARQPQPQAGPLPGPRAGIHPA